MTDFSRLVDPRFGLVTALLRREHGPELPSALISFTASVADSRFLGPWQGDRVALGCAFWDETQARRAAIGEAVERTCGNFIPRGLQRATFRQLAARGEAALDPRDLPLYSESQYRARGFPFVRFTPDLPILWAQGEDLADGSRVLLPASLVYINYFAGALAAEPKTHFVAYAGIATGPSRTEAERAALEELIERDATMIWWHAGAPSRRIDIAGSARLSAALESPGDASGLDYRLIEIANPLGVPVLGALLLDRKNDLAVLGSACRTDPLGAALKALAEAIHLRAFSLQMLDPNGSVWGSMRAGILDARAYKPFRADRRYLDHYRPDWRDVTDLGAQAQVWLDPRLHPALEPLLEAAGPFPLAGVPALAGEDRRAALLERLAAHGLRAYSAEVTTPDVASCGLSVVRVIVPGLVPNAPAAFPYLGCPRLYTEPARLGWSDRPLEEDELVRTPLPHA